MKSYKATTSFWLCRGMFGKTWRLKSEMVYCQRQSMICGQDPEKGPEDFLLATLIVAMEIILGLLPLQQVLWSEAILGVYR